LLNPPAIFDVTVNISSYSEGVLYNAKLNSTIVIFEVRLVVDRFFNPDLELNSTVTSYITIAKNGEYTGALRASAVLKGIKSLLFSESVNATISSVVVSVVSPYPTSQPTSSPSSQPSSQPSISPTSQPSSQPTINPGKKANSAMSETLTCLINCV
jgi:hypothetical protein